MTAIIRVLIADDHQIVREGLRLILETGSGIEVVGEACDGGEAVTLAEERHPDVILMDLRMPGMDGLTAIDHLQQQQPETAVVILTTYNEDDMMLRGLRAGARGYLLKDAPRETLYRAIRAAAKGESVLAPAVATRLLGQMRAPAQEALSAREIEVLACVARGASNVEIAHQLHISKATVKTHLIHIFSKLGVSDRTLAVTTALQRGILRLET